MPGIVEPAQERRRFESLVNSIDGIVWEVELPAWRFTFVSEQAERILGYPISAWSDPNFWPDHLYPEDRSWAVDFCQTTTARGENHQFEYRMITADGRIVWLRDIVTVEMTDGRPTQLRGVLVDITEHKNAELFHQGQRRVLEMIASAAALSDVLTSLLHLIELQSNGMLCSILLLDEDGVHIRHGAAPSLPEGYSRAIDGASIGPQAGSCGTAMYRAKPVIVTDILEDPLWENYKGLAQAHNLRACWSTPILSSSGMVLGSFAMYYHEPRHPSADETRLTSVATHLAGIAIERQRVEHALRRSEEKYRRIVDTAHEGIWVVDETARIVFVNQRMAEILGYSAEELVGRQATDFTDESFMRSDHRKERRRSGVSEQFDVRVRRKDGSELWVIVSTTPVLGANGDFGGSLGMVTDITERKQAEEALRRSSEQIQEMAGRLITAQEEERRRISRELHDDIVQKVAALAIHMSRVKQRLAAAENPLAGELETLQQRVFSLADDIRQISHQLHPVLLEHGGLLAALKSFTAEFTQLEGIEVALSIPDRSDAIPRDIAVCVFRVVQESLRNIAKHARAKRAEVALAMAGECLELRIQDNGVGFEIDHARGKGLGLSSVEERIRYCQGAVEISSQVNRGTTVAARIPLRTPAEA